MKKYWRLLWNTLLGGYCFIALVGATGGDYLIPFLTLVTGVAFGFELRLRVPMQADEIRLRDEERSKNN